MLASADLNAKSGKRTKRTSLSGILEGSSPQTPQDEPAAERGQAHRAGLGRARASAGRAGAPDLTPAITESAAQRLPWRPEATRPRSRLRCICRAAVCDASPTLLANPTSGLGIRIGGITISGSRMHPPQEMRQRICNRVRCTTSAGMSARGPKRTSGSRATRSAGDPKQIW
jgi:hypothetical protein